MLTLTARSSGAGLDKPLDIVRGASARLPWAWDGLCFAVPFNETDVNGSRDIVNNQAPSVFTGVSWDRDNRGNIVAVLATGDYIDYPDHPRHDLPSKELTVYARLKRLGAGDAWGAIVSNIYSLSSPWTTWIISDSAAADGTLVGNVAVGGGGIADTPATSAIPTTEYVSTFLRFGKNSPPALDVLGERGNTLSSTVGTTGANLSLDYAVGKGIRINGNEATTPATMNANYSQVMVWQRRLTDVEMTSLVSDPFGWYSPRRETVSLNAPFPVGPGMAAQPMTIGGSGRR